MDLDTMLQLGPAWKRTPDEKHSLRKLSLQEEDKAAMFQLTAANKWKHADACGTGKGRVYAGDGKVESRP